MSRRLIVSTLLALTALVALVAVGGQPLAAQEAPASQAVTTDELSRLVDTLEDPEARDAFIANLKAAIAAQATEETPSEELVGIGGRTIGFVSDRVDQLAAATLGLVEALSDPSALVRRTYRAATDPERRALWTDALIKLVIILGLGAVAFRLTRRALARPTGAIEQRQIEAPLARLPSLVARAILDLLPTVAFVAVAFVVLPLVGPMPTTRVVAVAFINATVLIQVALVLSRAILAPHSPNLRLFALQGATAAYTYVWVRRIAYFAAYGYVLAQSLLALGFSEQATDALLRLVGLVVAAMLIVVILQNRQPVAAWLGGSAAAGEPRSSAGLLRRQLADSWHILAIIYVAGVFLVWALRVPDGFAYLLRGTLLTAAIIALARVLTAAARHAAQRGFSVGPLLGARYPMLQHRADRYTPAVGAVARVLIHAIAGLAILQAWDVEVFGALNSAAGRAVITAVLSILLMAALAIFAWEFISAMIESRLQPGDDESGPSAPSARARTLLPLLRNAVLVLLIVLFSLVALSEIGVDTAPLLAAAGVVGLAIGFGAQKLVQDVINGLFILLENTITVGDVVNLGGNAGLVEGMSVRTITLRNLAGEVHTIPFSEVSTILNMTKDFSYAVLDVGVAYRENIAVVMDVIAQVGAELQNDERIGPFILEPLEMLGLDSFDDSAIIIRARIKTKPIKQFAVKRSFNLRLKERFDELGIEIPFPHQTLYFGEDRSGNAPPLHVLLNREAGQDKGTPPTSQPPDASVRPQTSEGQS